MPLSWESRVRPQNHMAVLSQQLYDSSTHWHQKYCNINNDIGSIKQLIKSASYKVCYISSIRTNYSSQCHEVSYIGSSTKTQKHTNDSMYLQLVLKSVIWIVYKSAMNQWYSYMPRWNQTNEWIDKLRMIRQTSITYPLVHVAMSSHTWQAFWAKELMTTRFGPRGSGSFTTRSLRNDSIFM